MTETEERIAAGLTPTQRELFRWLRACLSEALEPIAPEHRAEARIAIGWAFGRDAVAVGHSLGDVVAVGAAMFRCGAVVH